MSTEGNRDVEVLIIGTGASGLGAAIRLLQTGVSDFLILEKAADLGGTWRDNTYPGCACDVPSHLYSYSFAPNAGWTRAFAGQAEIWAYLRRTAERHGVIPHIRYRTEATEAHWNDTARRWQIETTRGRYSARVLIAAAGPWHEPLIPDIPGLNGFTGEVFHSSRWNHEFDLAGKRIAVVGTGASAIQFVPAIAGKVGRLHLFQRTAQWVLPKPDHYVPGIERSVMRHVPGARWALRTAEYAALETFGIGFRHPRMLRAVQQIGRAHLYATVRDPGLRRALTPDYTLGCKRILMSNSYYPALTRPNVEVHATAVAGIRGDRVIGADGTEAEVDAIVFGTGFHILDMPVADRVFDSGGRSLAETWAGSPQAYRGTTVAGYPNLFLLLGPNLGTGHTSAFHVLEAQLAYVIDAVRSIRRHGWASIDVRPEVQESWNAEVQAALATTVYNAGGCSSYYLDVNGRNSFSWPWSSGRMARRVRAFDPRAYDIRHAARQPLEATA